MAEIGNTGSPMIQLNEALRAWHTPGFETSLKRELERIDPQALPLQQGLSQGSHVTTDPIKLMVLRTADLPDRIRARIGVFYTGIIAGCNCADDPTPVEGQAEYCEVQVDIDKETAEAVFSLLPGD